MSMTTVKVSNVSLGAKERDIKEFFSFSGDIEYVEMQSDTERAQTAYVTFKDSQGAETAMLLSGATIVDMSVSIDLAPDYKLPPAAIARPLVENKAPGGAESALRKAEDVVSSMLAKGFILGKDAVGKAKSLDEKHQLTSTASSKVVSFDKKIGLSEKISVGTAVVGEKISAGTAVVGDKVREVDQKFHVSEKTKSAFSAAEQTVSSAGSAIMKNRYVLTGASWVTGAFSRVSKAAGEVGQKTKEKMDKAEEEQKRKVVDDFAQVHLSESEEPKPSKPEPVRGHFIQHCPTNGDPNYDIKRVKPPTGIPKSMLMATPDGSYALPSGVVATLKPNEAAFEKEIEGLPSTRSIGELPPELHCPLCKEVMKDAVLTSKCCFNSFCDKCIREHIISKSMCVCGATNILADDLLPNKTLRDTISRILESGNSSAENAGSAFQVQDMESARGPQLKVPSPTLSSASEQRPPLTKVEETLNVNIVGNEVKDSSVPPQMSDKGKNVKVPDVSEATHESMSVREPTSQGSALLPDEEVQQKVVSGEAAKKKKPKKVRQPANDLQRRIPLDSAADNYMMPLGPSGFNPYWTGMQPAMDGFMGPYAGSFPSMPYNMGYGMGPMDMSFGVMPPHDPFSNQAYMSMMLPVPQRDLSGFGMHMNAPPPPIMSREEFEARKADIRRKRENENQGERRETLRGRDYGRDKRGVGDGPSMSSKKSTMDAPPAELHPRQYPQRSERVSPDQTRDDLEPTRRGTKRRSTELNRDRERDHSSDYDYCDSHQDRPHGRSESAKRLTSSDPHHSRSESSKRPPSSDPHHSRSESSKRPPSSDPHHGRSESSKRLQSSDPHPGTSESSKRLPSSDPHRGRSETSKRLPSSDPHRGRSETSKRLPSSDPAKPEPSSSTSAALDCKQKTSVFSRISFPENEPSKKPKISSSSSAEDPSLSTHHKDGLLVSNGHCDDHKSSSLKSAAASGSGAGGRKRSSRVDHESSDDERHFKRKPTKYEPTPSPPPSRPKEEGRRHSRGSRDRDHR